MTLHSVLGAIGATPCVHIHHLTKKHVQLHAKLEFLNPGASAMDRYAQSFIEQFMKEQDLAPGSTLLVVSDSQLDTSLAMVCAQKGLRLFMIMCAPPETQISKQLRLLGVEFIAWPASQRHESPESFAKQLAARENWHFLDLHGQGDSAIDFHDSTAFELFNTFSETAIDFLFLFNNNTPQIDYIIQQFKRYSPATRLILCELCADPTATEKPQISEQELQQCMLHADPAILKVPQDIAKWGCLMAAQKEGILTGLQGGATLAAAAALSQTMEASCSMVCVLSDRVETYLQSEVFDFPSANLGFSEVSFSSTPPNKVQTKAQFTLQLPVIEVEESEPLISDITIEMLKQLITNPTHPVVMFGLESCEFCWATRKLFARLAIPVHCVDLDSVAYQACRLGEKMRATLAAHTDTKNLPQMFIGGEFIGNSMDVFDMVNNRALFRKLDRYNIPYNKVLNIDPYVLLPGWSHEKSV